ALRSRYDTEEENLKDARRLLEDLRVRVESVQRDFFGEATSAILADLVPENVGRLEAFLTLARQAERDRKQGRQCCNDPGELLALAVTGWLLGKEAAENKVEVAQRLWKARQFVLEYQRTEDEYERTQLLRNYRNLKADETAIDELTQLITHLPPP